jgi:GMP synthase (glutamine-hydrolysing)
MNKGNVMQIKCLIHADFETPGIIEDWARSKGYGFSICKPYQGEDCLADEEFDFLIVMGGPQSPLQLDKYPYLKDEIELIARATQQNKIILGFCLGAQLIGEALGGRTERSPEKELGVYPITLTEAGRADVLLKGFPVSFPVIHWHNDMPGEASDSQLLAYSEGCPKQIIKYGSKIYGFQCHLEITLEGIKTMIEACPEDLTASKFTQTSAQLFDNDYTAINNYMIQILDRLVV